MPDAPIFVLGDPHGQFDRVVALLREAGLIDADLGWSGGDATLWCLGDLCDRGPNGIGVIDLFMRLEREAPASGGAVKLLLGNHDALLLSACRLGEAKTTGLGGTFIADWLRNGGLWEDLNRLNTGHVAWLSRLPAMARHGDWLLVHADAPLYLEYGRTIDEVNRRFATLLAGGAAAAWDHLLDVFSVHRAFSEHNPNGPALAAEMLRVYGGQRLLHGHTPISGLTGQADGEVTEPLVYNGGRCVDVDGGMYRGGPGFLFRLDLPDA